MMSGEIVRESGLMMMLGTMTAQQRVAAFLLNLSKRMKTRGYSSAEFNLRMTREEIGSYLGLKLETVSRVFSKLQQAGVIDTNIFSTARSSPGFDQSEGTCLSSTCEVLRGRSAPTRITGASGDGLRSLRVRRMRVASSLSGSTPRICRGSYRHSPITSR